tara:strand:+ start:217 stop:570 length:354 start_codon:yes stop_codon:yes gene_type:complete
MVADKSLRRRSTSSAFLANRQRQRNLRALSGLAGDEDLPVMLLQESNHAERRTDAIDDDEDPMDAWQDCLVEHDELRPEAYVQRSTKEQQQILKEMFGDEWTEEDDAQIVEASAAAA